MPPRPRNATSAANAPSPGRPAPATGRRAPGEGVSRQVTASGVGRRAFRGRSPRRVSGEGHFAAGHRVGCRAKGDDASGEGRLASRVRARPGRHPLQRGETFGYGDLFLAGSQVRAPSVLEPAGRDPAGLRELQPAVVAVARVGFPVAARLAPGDGVPVRSERPAGEAVASPAAPRAVAAARTSTAAPARNPRARAGDLRGVSSRCHTPTVMSPKGVTACRPTAPYAGRVGGVRAPDGPAWSSLPLIPLTER